MANLVLVSPIMTNNNEPKPYVISSNKIVVEASKLYFAMDNSLSTSAIWNTVNEYINLNIDMGIKTTVSYFIVKSGSLVVGESDCLKMTDVVLYGSNDGISYTMIFEKHDVIMDDTNNFTFTQDLGKLYKYRYYRFSVKNSSGIGSHTAIRDLKMFVDTDLITKKKFTKEKIKEQNLPHKVDLSEDKVIITEVGNIYVNKNDGTLMKVGGSGAENLIESISVNGTQQSIDANKNVDISVPTKTSDLINDSNFITDDNLNATYMKKSEYVSSVNNENVKCSDIALKIKDVDTSNPQQYYGKDVDGNIGFHYLPITPTDVPATEQRVINNAIADDSYIIDSNIDLSNVKLFTQCYKKIDGRQDIITNIDVFDEYNKNKYIYNNKNVAFDTSAYIKNNFTYTSTKVGDLYESEEIDKTQFLEEMVVSL